MIEPVIHRYRAGRGRKFLGGEGFDVMQTSGETSIGHIPGLGSDVDRLFHAPLELEDSRGAFALQATKGGMFAEWKRGGLLDRYGRSGARIGSLLGSLPEDFPLAVIPRLFGTEYFDPDPNKYVRSDDLLDTASPSSLRKAAKSPLAGLSGSDFDEMVDAISEGLTNFNKSGGRIDIRGKDPFMLMEGFLATIPNAAAHKMSMTTSLSDTTTGVYDAAFLPGGEQRGEIDPKVRKYVNDTLTRYRDNDIEGVRQALGASNDIEDIGSFIKNLPDIPASSGKQASQKLSDRLIAQQEATKAQAEVKSELAVGTSAKREAARDAQIAASDARDRALRAFGDPSKLDNPNQRFIRDIASDVTSIGSSLAPEMGYDLPTATREFSTSTNKVLADIFDEIGSTGNSPLEVFQANVDKFDLPDSTKKTLSERANVRMAGIMAGKDSETIADELPRYSSITDAEFEARFTSTKLFSDDIPASAPAPSSPPPAPAASASAPSPAPAKLTNDGRPLISLSGQSSAAPTSMPSQAPAAPAAASSFLDELDSPLQSAVPDENYDDFIKSLDAEPVSTPSPKTSKRSKGRLKAGKNANVPISTGVTPRTQPLSPPPPDAAPAPDLGAPSRTFTSGEDAGSAELRSSSPNAKISADPPAGAKVGASTVDDMAQTAASSGAPAKSVIKKTSKEMSDRVVKGGNLKMVGLGAVLGVGAMYGLSERRRTVDDNVQRRLEMQRNNYY